MTETAEQPMPHGLAAEAGDEVEEVLRRVREAVVRSREAIAETQELLGAPPPGEAAQP